MPLYNCALTFKGQFWGSKHFCIQLVSNASKISVMVRGVNTGKFETTCCASFAFNPKCGSGSLLSSGT
jgi:hypothetical protein